MKVNSANVCLDCDTLFANNECPQCLGHSYHPLRKWLRPLHSFADIKEAKKHDLSLQKEREEGLSTALYIPGILELSPEEFERRIKEFQSRGSCSVNGNSEAESPKSEVGIGYYPNRIGVATIDCVEQRRSWLDAGYAFYRNVVRFLKGRPILSCKEYYRRDYNSQALPTDKSKLESSTGKV